MRLSKKWREILFSAKVLLLVIALFLLGSSVLDLFAATSPSTCSTGGACIQISQTAVLIQGVNFVATLEQAVLGSIATVIALALDVVEFASKE
jgi:hypothetical protein